MTDPRTSSSAQEVTPESRQAVADASTARPLPLTGVTVLDLGRYYLAPYAGFLLAQAGAFVIKLEPVDGEPMRGRRGGKTTYAGALLNTGKRHVTLNLKHAQGRDLLRALVARCDVLLENFAPGVLDRMGLGYRALSEINPRLVYGSGTGFGLSGPDREGLALDPVIQAHAGVAAVTGPSDGAPYKAGPAIADFIAGTHLYGGVVTALFERERTGRGRLVEIAMQEALVPTLASNISALRDRGAEAARSGNRHYILSPYNLYRARDGYVAVLCTTEDQWRKLLTAMGREELATDPRFATNKARLAHIAETDAAVEAWTAQLDRAAIFAAAKRLGIPAAPVRELEEVLSDPHMHERGMLLYVDHPEVGRMLATRSPMRYHDSALAPVETETGLGQHNRDVYGTWLGRSEEELQTLREAGTI